MTAPAADDVRGQLVRALREFWEADVGEPLDDLDVAVEVLDQYADALLPVVSRIADQRAVDELRSRARMVSTRASNETDEGVQAVLDETAAWMTARADSLARFAPPTEPKEQQ